jgi:pyrimidine deaminase RibD-like protein
MGASSNKAVPGFDDTELGALGRRCKTWVRLEPSNSRGRSPCCAILAREAQVRLPTL